MGPPRRGRCGRRPDRCGGTPTSGRRGRSRRWRRPSRPRSARRRPPRTWERRRRPRPRPASSARSNADRIRRRMASASSRRLEAGREGLPGVVAEIGMGRAGGDHQLVVGDRPGVGQRACGAAASTPIARLISTRALAWRLQQVADRPGDLGRRQGGGGHLVEQGLEGVMVARVDDHDFDRRARRARAAARPPNPAPTMTTRGRPDRASSLIVATLPTPRLERQTRAKRQGTLP